ncbi:MAG: MogA/MoaB family molybdenum cofactor biosynthesis protein [Methanosarcinales archaeon Met12]|nr:MAG: MogA/MoaB family molybdenum cofactor biosynthesis protein [Methanosarcinales archaeon Met12]
MGVNDHKCHALENVRCVVLTLSDTRTEETDESGKLIKDLLQEHGHIVVGYTILKDELETIRKVASRLIDNPDVQVIITNGGTGICHRDVTIEALSGLFDKKLDGFGEIFRFLGYEEVGSVAMMSRALAGIAKGKVIICLPGSKNAVALGMKKLVIPVLGHMVWEANR